jgi:hypothetical protein
MSLPFLLAVVLLELGSCSQPKPSVSFYYWKTVFDLSLEERAVLKSNHVKRLYVRYFDVVVSEGKAMPRSPVSFVSKPDGWEVVPVIYVKNEVMMSKTLDIVDLAKKVMTLVASINVHEGLAAPSEIQLDCDWSLESRETYFKFIDALRTAGVKIISATIRLHQVKYVKKTGMPPVDRGVLMFYNMGHLAADSSNSIYERATAARYTQHLDAYPLKLDVALPMFSWGLHIRGNKVIGILNKVDDNVFLHDPNFKMKAAPFFEVTHNVLKLDHYFEEGDRIKIETVTTTDLSEMASDLSGDLPAIPGEIIFYDLDNFNLKHYRHEDDFYKKISSAF